MSAQFEYDESGGTSLYFLVSFYALFLFPLTYYLWPSKQKKDDPEKLKKQCQCHPCLVKKAKLQAKKPTQKLRHLLKWGLLFGAWVLFIYLAVRASQVERDHVEYDPYDILELDRGVTQAEIKRKYRLLTKTKHPDKGGDPVEFMRIAKAYAALTDDESRENWEKYGNPDGPTATSFGIALPAWVVDQNNSILVLGAYGLAIMVILPIAVGTWWYRSIRYSAVEVLLDTSQLFLHFIYKTPCLNLKRALMILSGSFEFEEKHNSEIVLRPSDNEELPPLMREFDSEYGKKSKEKPFVYPYSRKARILLYAHLARTELPLETLDVDKKYIVSKCPQLIQEMINTASQLVTWKNYGRVAKEPRLESIEFLMRQSPMIVQACWDKTPLLQLPHFNEDTLRKKRHIKAISQFVKMKDADRRNILRHLHEKQYQDILNVLKSLPKLDADVELEVLADEDKKSITAGSLVTATVTLRRGTFQVLDDESNDPVDAVEDAVVEDTLDEDKTDSPVPHKPKTHVWEKHRRKKNKGGGGGAKNKAQKKQATKKAAAAAALKAAEESPQHNGKGAANHVSNNTKGAIQELDPNKDSGDSGSESDNEQEDNSKHSSDDNNSSDGGEQEEEEWERLQSGITRKEKVLEGTSKTSHEVHCPYFPEVKQEWWWIYLADRKTHRIITLPQMIYDLVDEKDIELKFPAPVKGLYQYQLCVRSDCYLDLDYIKSIKVDVKEAKKVEEMHPQWDISDDEDKEEEGDSDVSDYTTDDEGSDEE
ncbi:translocation protein SEC63 homolog [Asterias amurensis]|uniref:translocation protein SEC63 homolog n=1 Tax=Asterias amurensis TaxID=7602 RepID=UPI003AB4064C